MLKRTLQCMSHQLLAQVHAHAKRSPQQIAYRLITRCAPDAPPMTYGQLKQRIDHFACRVRDAVAPGSVVILRCPNTLDYAAMFLGILAAGCNAFPISPEAASDEVRRAAETSCAAAIVIADGAIETLALLAPPDLVRNGGPGLLLQSSGTTGLPKIAFRSGASIDAVSRNMVGAIDFRVDDRVLATVPLCHSYGLEHGLLAPMWAGSSVFLVQGLDLHLITETLAVQHITLLPGVPSMYEMMSSLADRVQIPSLRKAYSAGGPLPRSVFDRFMERFGHRIGQLYGATEVGSVTFSDPTREDFDPSSVGRPMEGVEIDIADQQVQIMAPSMFSGYIDERIDLSDGGFFPTGDLGRITERGDLVITGRSKLLIDVGGLKVNPIEVEEVLVQHPGVAECVVVPIRMSETVSRIKAIVVARVPKDPPSADELRAFARARLAGYKVPRVIEFREALPKSPTGKVLRHLL
ncbi:MAG TPA: AMP-binding protein, partial [Tepidisphaeraceae bacterium]|nr:AMP-binding protein [Tepidisphaeraceae bacterium]